MLRARFAFREPFSLAIREIKRARGIPLPVRWATIDNIRFHYLEVIRGNVAMLLPPPRLGQRQQHLTSRFEIVRVSYILWLAGRCAKALLEANSPLVMYEAKLQLHGIDRPKIRDNDF